MSITIAYTPEYLRWEGSAASPRRAALAVEHIQHRARDEHAHVEILTPELTSKSDKLALRAELEKIHDPAYVARALRGKEPAHEGAVQGHTAALMFQGTRVLVDAIERDGYATGVYFNPQGAKHHAAYNHASGFCVFNDMAWAAHHFTEQGLRVAYLDWDAHHGDGVEDLTRTNKNVLTASIHEWGIFPGTGKKSSPRQHVYNYPLDAHDDDTSLIDCVDAALEKIATFRPDVLLMAIGADGHTNDPLSRLDFTVEGYIDAAGRVADLAVELDIPVLVGGAGGYSPFTFTPIIWAEVIRELDAVIRAGAHAD